MHARALLDSFGEGALRDLGLRATEGTFSIPLTDGVADGVLALHSNFYEFIPIDEIDQESPTTLRAHELTLGAQYYLVITTFGGLYRYDMNAARWKQMGLSGKKSGPAGLCTTPQADDHELFEHPAVRAGILYKWQQHASHFFHLIGLAYVACLVLFSLWSVEISSAGLVTRAEAPRSQTI